MRASRRAGPRTHDAPDGADVDEVGMAAEAGRAVDGCAEGTGGVAGSSSNGRESAESGDDGDSSVAVVDDDSPSQTDLRDRLRQARLMARGHRHSAIEEKAATIASYGLWRTLRRERRRKAETIERFKWREVRRPNEGTPADPHQGVRDLFAAAGQQILLDAPPALPGDPPEPEDEAIGDGPDGRPPDLPLSMAWWRDERERQRLNPFKAGKVQTVGLEFQLGQRPTPPDGFYLEWGPQMRTDKLPTDDRRDFLRILAKDYRANGASPCRWSDIDAVTPIRLVRHPVTGKARIAHDSRAVNVRLMDSTAAMARAADALMKGGVAAKVDLLMAFRHIGLKECDKRVLGFVIDGQPWRWEALTFGCSQSPALFAAALDRTLRSITLPDGARLVVYVDDILIVAGDVDTLDAATRQLCRGLSDSGWYVALDKAFMHAMRLAPFLGLVVNLRDDRLQVARRKANRLRELCSAAITARKATLAVLQRVGGLLAFMAQAAPECALCRHGINAATAEAERLPGRTVCVRGRLLDDLVFWRDNAAVLPDLAYPDADGLAIDVATDAAGLPSLAYGGLVWAAESPAPDIDEALGEVERWKSNPANGQVIAGGGEVYAGPFPVACSELSSSALETRALRLVLTAYRQKHGPNALRGKIVRWLCDSQVATGCVERWRAKAAGLASEVRELLILVRSLGCRLRPEWVSREAGWQPVADAISKVRWVRDSAEWSMAAEDVVSACYAATDKRWAAPSIDLFGTAHRAVAKAWVSLWPEKGSAWTDAFARPWRGLRQAWAFPPFSVAAATLRQACCGDLDAVIIVPRSTAVPARLEGCRRVQLADLALIDAEGRRAHGKCPVQLDAIHVAPG